jgi:predicted CoA-substrate-specific enzyme activase
VTEITCHAKGAQKLFGLSDLDVIDIGGQDTKVICARNGSVRDFLMNDKCSAGTGRFLEVMANTLAMDPPSLIELAGQGGDTSISSMCTVFAESEVISLIGKGERKENIAFAVVSSIAKKIASQASRICGDSVPTVLTGGLCEADELRRVLEIELGRDIASCPEARYAGAIGAALLAEKL